MGKTKPQLDLFGEPIPVVPKCANCGKAKGYHRAGDLACPYGKKDRTGGFSFPHGEAENHYEPKEK